MKTLRATFIAIIITTTIHSMHKIKYDSLAKYSLEEAENGQLWYHVTWPNDEKRKNLQMFLSLDKDPFDYKHFGFAIDPEYSNLQTVPSEIVETYVKWAIAKLNLKNNHQ